MPHQLLSPRFQGLMIATSFFAAFLAAVSGQAEDSPSLRKSAIVTAIEQARQSVVNIHGRKTLESVGDDAEDGEGMRQVNGMGTGVVVDERGYILTNYHVVEGVSRVLVTMADDKELLARLVERDTKTDLAIVKVDVDKPLRPIRIGTSADLMVGETVIAIGNAYGYPNTITTGIISALHRPVQVSESQKYPDLIQTDASINPGNSGGPLLNIDGDMIGLNVAVRVGAQGIGFAVPIDHVLEVASQLMDAEVAKTVAHGISGKSVLHSGESEFVVASVVSSGPARAIGVHTGDVIASVGDVHVSRGLDFQRALVGRQPGDEVPLGVRRNGESLQLRIVLAEPSEQPTGVLSRAWTQLGVRLTPISGRSFRNLSTRYRGGLRVVSVRPEGPASQQGIKAGDVLLGILKWETTSLDDVAYILESDEFRESSSAKFYILRGDETLFGHFRISRR